MIPLYPPRQGDPNLRRLVKWRSLVHFGSHSHEEGSDHHVDNAPRVRSLSTVVFFPSHRKLSSSSQKQYNTRKVSHEEGGRSSSLERRRPSAPSLSDLRRFLPNLIKSSTNVIEGEEGAQTSVQKGVELGKHQTQSHYHVENTAKSKVQRLKAFATTSSALPKETGAGTRPNFFKKQGRKPFGQPAVLASVSSTSVQSSHGFDEESAPLISIQSKSGNAKKPQQTATENSFSKSVEEAVDKNFVAQPISTDCVILHTPDRTEAFGEEDQENPVIVVVDPSSLKERSHSKTKGSDRLFVNDKKAGSASSIFTATKQRSLCSNDPKSGKEEVVEYSVVEQRLSPQTFNSTTNSNLLKPKIFQSTRNRRHLIHPASSVLSSSFHAQTSSTPHQIRFLNLNVKTQLPKFNNLQRLNPFNRLTYPLSQSEESNRDFGKFNRNYYSKHQQDSLLSSSTHQNKHFVSNFTNPQNALFVRRHSLPDMAIAAYGMVICGTDELQHKYRGRIEKVRFGVPISEAFSHDIPGTLLVLLLQINKEGPLKKDIWRAPGNQSQVRKLSRIMEHGRLVNISHISTYTSASIIKRFLSKLPGGIFGIENEQLLFNNMKGTTNEHQRQVFCRVICSLPTPSQHLLVLLFGTFRIIADSADTFNTRMNPDAIGISVAPSLFHTCMQDEHKAKLEDVMRFKLASEVISKIIQSFGYTNLFPRECYEFYARITGRTLRVDEFCKLSFSYPSRTFSQPSICFGTGQPISSESDKHGEDDDEQPGPSGFRSKSQRDSKEGRRRSSEAEDEDVYSEELPGPSRALHPRRNRAASSGSAGPPLHHSGYWRHPRDAFSDLMEQRQLSTSMGEVLLHSEYERVIGGESLSDRPSGHPSPYQQTMASRYADSTKSLTYLEWVHEKQTKRMRTRSEWFLSPVMPQKGTSKSFDFHSHFQHSPSPLHLKLPETDTDRSLQSSTEEMRTASSHSSSIKEQRPLSPIKIIESSLDPVVRKVEEMAMLSGETTPRLPFQLLQHHSGDSDDAPLSATPPARHQAPVFFGDDVPPAKTQKSSSSSSSGSQSQKSVIGGPSASTTTGQQPASSLTRVSSIGVVRRKSWRMHYVRPNKSLDQESAPKEDLGPTSHSTPASGTRRSSANGDKGPVDEGTRLIRRKSSNSASKSKVPVQARKSTQI